MEPSRVESIGEQLKPAVFQRATNGQPDTSRQQAAFEVLGEELAKSVSALATGVSATVAAVELRPAERLGDGAGEARLVLAATVEGAPESISLCVSRGCIMRWVDVSLGGSGAVARNDAKTWNGIERRLAAVLAQAILNALSAVVGQGGGASRAAIDKEISPTAAARALRETGEVLAIDVAIAGAGEGEYFTIALPLAVRDWFNARLSAGVQEDATGGGGDVWCEKLVSSVAGAPVVLTALLATATITLGDIARWQVGDFIGLKVTPAVPALVESADVPLFWCDIGKHGDMLTVRVREEFVDDDNPFDGLREA